LDCFENRRANLNEKKVPLPGSVQQLLPGAGDQRKRAGELADPKMTSVSTAMPWQRD
jgi:hypothetical protein